MSSGDTFALPPGESHPLRYTAREFAKKLKRDGYGELKLSNGDKFTIPTVKAINSASADQRKKWITKMVEGTIELGLERDSEYYGGLIREGTIRAGRKAGRPKVEEAEATESETGTAVRGSRAQVATQAQTPSEATTEPAQMDFMSIGNPETATTISISRGSEAFTESSLHPRQRLSPRSQLLKDKQERQAVATLAGASTTDATTTSKLSEKDSQMTIDDLNTSRQSLVSTAASSRRSSTGSGDLEWDANKEAAKAMLNADPSKSLPSPAIAQGGFGGSMVPGTPFEGEVDEDAEDLGGSSADKSLEEGQEVGDQPVGGTGYSDASSSSTDPTLDMEGKHDDSPGDQVAVQSGQPFAATGGDTRTQAEGGSAPPYDVQLRKRMRGEIDHVLVGLYGDGQDSSLSSGEGLSIGDDEKKDGISMAIRMGKALRHVLESKTSDLSPETRQFLQAGLDKGDDIMLHLQTLDEVKEAAQHGAGQLSGLASEAIATGAEKLGEHVGQAVGGSAGGAIGSAAGAQLGDIAARAIGARSSGDGSLMNSNSSQAHIDYAAEQRDLDTMQRRLDRLWLSDPASAQRLKGAIKIKRQRVKKISTRRPGTQVGLVQQGVANYKGYRDVFQTSFS
jgi:hypothetical protein